MAKGKRRRIEPAAAADTHNILSATSLGASDDSDAEAVFLVGDECNFSTQLGNAAGGTMSNIGNVKAVSSWTDCKDSAVLRIKAEYRAASGTRKFLVQLRSHDNVVWTSGIIEPENTGLDDGASLGASTGYHAGGFDNFESRGMKEFRVIVLAGTTAVDLWGGAA